MNQNVKTGLIAALVAIITVVGFRFVGNQTANPEASTLENVGAALGITRFPNSGLVVRFLKITSSAGTATVGNDGSFSATGSSTLSSVSFNGGAPVTLSDCTSTQWNAAAISSSSVATTSIPNIAGLQANDVLSFSLGTSTVSSTVGVAALLSGSITTFGTTSTILAQLSWPINTAQGTWDIATSTLEVCWRRQ